MVHDVRLPSAIDGAEIALGAEIGLWREQPAGEVDVHQVEPEAPDSLAVLADAGRDGHVVPGIAGGDGKTDPVRPEVPVFGDDEHEAVGHGVGATSRFRRIRIARTIRPRLLPLNRVVANPCACPFSSRGIKHFTENPHVSVRQ